MSLDLGLSKIAWKRDRLGSPALGRDEKFGP